MPGATAAASAMHMARRGSGDLSIDVKHGGGTTGPHRAYTPGATPSIYTATSLRRLFRRLDTDHSGTLSFAELKDGAAELGLGGGAHGDDARLAGLMGLLDGDGDGEVTESEFLDYFQHARTAELRATLATAPRADAAVVTAIRWSGGADAQTDVLAAPAVAAWLDRHVLAPAASGERRHVWLDVVGFDRDVMQLLEHAVGAPEAALRCGLVARRQGVEVTAPQPALLTHALRRRASSTEAVARAAAATVTGAPPPPPPPPRSPPSTSPAPPTPLQLVLHASWVRRIPLRTPAARHGRGTTARCVCRAPRSGDADLPSDEEDAADAVQRGRDIAVGGAQGTAAVPLPTAHRHTYTGGASATLLRFAGCARESLWPRPGDRLASRAALLARAPSIASEQLAVVLVDEFTLVTVRRGRPPAPPHTHAADHPDGGHRARTWAARVGGPGSPPPIAGASVSTPLLRRGAGGGAVVTDAESDMDVGGGEASPAADADGGVMRDGSVLGELLHGVAMRLANAAHWGAPAARTPGAINAPACELADAGVGAVAVEIVDAVVEFTHASQDELVEWLAALSDGVHAEPSRAHTAHLYALRQAADDLARDVEPLRDAFARLIGGGDAHAPPPAATPHSYLKASAAAWFPPDVSPRLHEVVGAVGALAADAARLQERLGPLGQLLYTMQQEQMNAVLYVLTIVGGAAAILTLLPSIWGMNFLDMSELDPATGPFTGVKLFWVVFASAVAAIAVFVWRCTHVRALVL